MTARLPLFLMLATLPAAIAIGQSATVSSLKGHNANAPVDVAADRIELQDRADRAIFTGNVKVKQGDMTMDAPRMTVAYARAAGADPQVQRIDASGGVTVTSPTETAKGNFGIYDVNRRLVTLIGNVRVTRGTNNVNGSRLTIDLTTGRASVDGSRVPGNATTTGPGGVAGGRVTGRFSVPQRTN
ncbi:LptA/OstA family protein [Sphingomonas naphthae]|uniref:LptA/OstA family protein n=1 Tax=Sphingomonas naphthae TaxID=1813468 RepID=A0ABY7TSQ6_9SPHN|nr:LptA/OstA family protein [Sphingomonas naphthae]WCT74904.1 LptA/OstA family protein [Sphingomonas naphthae]